MPWQLGGLPRPAHPSSRRRDTAVSLEKTKRERHRRSIRKSGATSAGTRADSIVVIQFLSLIVSNRRALGNP